MQPRVRPVLTFFLMGMFFWAVGGFIVSIIGFQTAVPTNEVTQSKEIAAEFMRAWIFVSLKVVGIWALAGGVLGIIVSQLYIHRPSYEHTTTMPTLPEMPGGPGATPKTLAEVNAAFQSWFVGGILGFCGTRFLLPLLQNDFILIKEWPTRVLFGTFILVIMTASILPMSLDSLNQQMLKRKKY